MEFNVMIILYDCAVILLMTKLLGMFTRKLGLPQVVGMIIAGILIGPAIFSQLDLGGFKGLINPGEIEKEVLHSFSQIGVVFILFSSGLETDFRELKKSGAAATAIAAAGVIVPIALGTLGTLMFMGGIGEITNPDKLMNAIFVGCILSATSVGITVETLRELGKLNTRIGTVILSAAIIDDVLGIIALSVVTGIGGGGNVGITLLKALGFFVFTIGVGLLMRILFKNLVRHYPHKRRTGIFALVMCFTFAFCAEELFGIAAITGAFMAGLMLSGMDEAPILDRKVVVSGYMIFTPIFFAYIGISADFSSFDIAGLVFALAFVAIGIIGKILGCSLTARAFKYKGKESLAAGFGMIARGEVALAVYAAGKSLIYYDENGVLAGIDPLVATIFLIIITSILCPVFLKLTFKSHHSEEVPHTHRLKPKNFSLEAMEAHLDAHQLVTESECKGCGKCSEEK